MSTRRIEDPEGDKTIILSYKSATGAAIAISGPNTKIGCFADTHTGRPKVDKNATAGGTQDTSMQGRRMVIFYMTIMHLGLFLNPTQCTQKTDRNAK